MKDNDNAGNLYYGANTKEKRIRGVKRHKLSYYMSAMNFFYKAVTMLVCVFVMVILFRTYILQHVVVDGASMEPAMLNGDHLFIEKISYQYSLPERFDIIVFRPYKDQPDCYYIKRVIGLPGETVQIINGYIYIDGERLDENYGLDGLITSPGIAADGITLDEDEYFVLGDNRNVSLDSRDIRVGPVKGVSIIGRAVVDFWPYKNFSILF